MKNSKGWTAIARDLEQSRHDKTAAEWNAERKKLLALIGDQEKQLEVALKLANTKTRTAHIKLKDDPKAEATAVAVASDWHVEETVLGKTVNNLNHFNLDVAEQRIHAFFRNVVKLTEIQRHGARIDRLMLVLGGDMMTGYIHEELIEGNSLSPTQTVLWLIERISSGIEYLSKHFAEIVVPCVMGNHGRTTQKPRHATAAANSYEWMMYRVLADKLKDKATWYVADGYHLLVDVYGKTIRVHHGDGLKYQGGIGGLTIPVEKAIASWNKGIPAHLDIFGHWHQSQHNPKWVSNGSLIGYGPYSVAIKAPFEKPTQTYFLFDKKHGRTGTFPIFLDHS